jgi:hypothetical protein
MDVSVISGVEELDYHYQGTASDNNYYHLNKRYRQDSSMSLRLEETDSDVYQPPDIPLAAQQTIPITPTATGIDTFLYPDHHSTPIQCSSSPGPGSSSSSGCSPPPKGKGKGKGKGKSNKQTLPTIHEGQTDSTEKRKRKSSATKPKPSAEQLKIIKEYLQESAISADENKGAGRPAGRLNNRTILRIVQKKRGKKLNGEEKIKMKGRSLIDLANESLL